MKQGFLITNRLTFKRSIIDELDEDGIYINQIRPIGIFQISKKDFYKDFSNVVKSASWDKGIYHYPTFPSWAKKYLTNNITDHNLISVKTDKNVHSIEIKDFIGNEIRDKIRELGKLWKNSDSNPLIDNDIKNKWEQLIYEWKDNKEMPLIVRKQSAIRGSEIIHSTGRKIIITDNSFSQWIYSNVMDNKTYSLDEIKTMLFKDEIPMCFAIKKEDVNKVKYRKTLGQYSVNRRGWKLCHIDGVGLNSKMKIAEIEIAELENHFIKLANPKNMFLLPLEIGSLGEIQEFINEQK